MFQSSLNFSILGIDSGFEASDICDTHNVDVNRLYWTFLHVFYSMTRVSTVHFFVIGKTRVRPKSLEV